MDASQAMLFFFSALGAFNGLLMGLYFLFIAKPRHISNYFLGALLISFSIRIGKSVFFHFNQDLSYGYLQFGLTGCFFIGPFLYFYIKSVVDPNGHILKTWKYHMAILVPVAIVVGYLFPFEYNIDLWRPHILNGIYHTWLVYSLLAGLVLWPTITKIFNKETKLTSIELWMVSILIGNMAIWAAYYFAGMTSYILGALLFSFIFYLLFLLFLFNRRKVSVLFKKQEKYKDKKILDVEAKALITKLRHAMEQEKYYTNPNLKLPDVAKKLNVLPHTISQLLNDNVGIGFPQFLNEYRIEEAKKMLKEENNLTLESIGYDCGFNSKSTFYSTFKKMTGTTPAKFKENPLLDT